MRILAYIQGCLSSIKLKFRTASIPRGYMSKVDILLIMVSLLLTASVGFGVQAVKSSLDAHAAFRHVHELNGELIKTRQDLREIKEELKKTRETKDHKHTTWMGHLDRRIRRLEVLQPNGVGFTSEKKADKEG